MSGLHPAIVRATAQPYPWERAAPDALVVILGDGSPERARATLGAAECALVGGDLPDPPATARRVKSLDPTVQVVIIAAREERGRIERAVLFTPGLGETWIVSADELSPELVARASEVTRQRRSRRVTNATIEHDLARIEPRSARRPLISDAYLAELLSVLPDPVISIDENDRVLSWNPSAERVLGHTRARAMGQPLPELVAPEDPAALAELLTASTPGERPEIGFRRPDGSMGIAEVAVASVEAAGHRIRAVVLHDITEERRAQSELEAQASELEMQAEELRSQALQLEETQAELEISNEELQAANTALSERTLEAEQARAAAEAATHEAEAANRAKSDFLATMSHEIRTPINAIMGYSELLEMGTSGPVNDAQRAQLERVRSSSRHLLMLIEDVLDLAKVEAGRLDVARDRVLAGDAVAEAIALLGPQAEENEIEIHDLCAEDGGAAYVGDADRVRQILVNLLSNAVKFTQPGGEIRVRCGTAAEADAGVSAGHHGPWAYTRVTDTGVGIAADQLENVFRPFVQAETGLTRTKGGTGLGLSISRQLARLMGGDLSATSEVGVGSTFTLWLPAADGAGSPADSPARRPE